MPIDRARNAELNFSWNKPRIVIGAPHGHSGKTTISIGLVGALREAGYLVQPFKKGPDYIDPSWLGYAAGRACRNLDCYWMSAEQIQTTLINGSAGSDVTIIEGAMGLFDGIDVKGTGSTAQIARITQSPVILVVDTSRMTRSIAPMVLGFMNFDRDIKISGVILNKVARPRHEKMLRAVIEEYCHIPVLGAIPKNAYSLFPERHLGLVPAIEHNSLDEAVELNVAVAREYLDLEAIVNLAKTALPLAGIEYYSHQSAKIVKIGVVRDQAFTFYYPENLEALEAAGAELVFIDTIATKHLPNIDGLYIGGGFPEVFGSAIQNNSSLRSDIRQAAEYGLPIYAECGGLMYLGRKIIWQDNEFSMCGVFPFDVVVEKKPQGHGYTTMKVIKENPFFTDGSFVEGHEFHHSRVINISEPVQYAYKVERGHGIDGYNDGIICKNTFATYNHIHSINNSEWAQHFIEHALIFKSHSKVG